MLLLILQGGPKNCTFSTNHIGATVPSKVMVFTKMFQVFMRIKCLMQFFMWLLYILYILLLLLLLLLLGCIAVLYRCGLLLQTE